MVRTDHSGLVVPVDEAREMGRLFKSLAMREKRHSHPRKESRKPDFASLDKAVLMRPIRLSTLPCDEWLLGGATTISQQNFDLKEVVRSMIEYVGSGGQFLQLTPRVNVQLGGKAVAAAMAFQRLSHRLSRPVL